MNVLNPPKSYIEYRSYVHGLSGPELSVAQDRFYGKHGEMRPEIINFCRYIHKAREEHSLPVEQIEIRDMDGKKHGNVQRVMIYDIEYWIEGGKEKQRKIYIPAFKDVEEMIDLKKRSAGEKDDE